MIGGLDVSLYQKNIDWSITASKARFAIIKASEANFTDPYFALNWARSKGKLPRAAYHFFHPNMDGAAQAKLFLKKLTPDCGDFIPWVDVEVPSEKWLDDWREQLRICLDALTQGLGYRPGVYTGDWYMPYVNAAKAPWLAQYPLWCANGGPKALVPAPWKDWVFWQWTSGGDPTAYGCQGIGLDLDWFNGDEAAFAAFLGRTITMTSVRITDANGKTMDATLPYKVEEIQASTPQWDAKFFVGLTPTGSPVFTAKYPGPALELNWGNGSPNAAVPVEGFSAIFTTTINLTAGNWQWKVRSDDGFRMRVDGVIVPGLDGWIEQSAASKEYIGHMALSAGSHTLQVDYFEKGGLAELHVSAPSPF